VFIEGEAAQDDGVHHRKDRGGGADAEGENDQRNRCERL
jgi:hypothetical protein